MFNVAALRAQFPALARRVADEPAVFFDGPAGSQVPQRVIEAIYRYFTECNANHGGAFVTARESDRLLDQAHAAAADLLGAPAPELVSFGANMTTLTFAVSRALARTWKAGDEVVVTRLEHDANFTPWVLAARDAGAVVRYVDIRRADCTLDLNDLRAKLSSRTRLVAVGCASNAVGTVNPVAEITRLAHGVGAQVFLDAVHFVPHAAPDVTAWDCDFLVCSAYKFFGPHVGLLYGKRKWLESLAAYKLRPAPDDLPGKWQTGTQSHEGIAGVLAAIEYLADVAGAVGTRRERLVASYEAIARYERDLIARLLAGLGRIPGVQIYGITDPAQFAHRLPTVSFTHARHTAQAVAERLAERGIFVWGGNFYALPLTEALGLEPEGVVRVGLLHYNTADEVDRLLAAVGEL